MAEDQKRQKRGICVNCAKHKIWRSPTQLCVRCYKKLNKPKRTAVVIDDNDSGNYFDNFVDGRGW